MCPFSLLRRCGSAHLDSRKVPRTLMSITFENADGEAPEIGADGAATILYFTETASGVFLVKGEVVQTIS